MWFSGKTGLITRMVARFDQEESELFLSDYRRLGGRRRATTQEGIEPSLAALYDESPVDRLRLDSLRALPPADSAVSPPGEDRAVRWLKATGIARVGFRYRGRHVWIRASINGLPPADFLLDTGASGTALDREYAEQQGLVKEGRFDVRGMGGPMSPRSPGCARSASRGRTATACSSTTSR